MKVRAFFVMFSLLLAASTSFAQCVPQNGPFVGPSGHMIDPPRYWDGSRGCYTWQGAPASGQVSNYTGQGQQVLTAPAQQVVNVNGRPMVWVRLSNGEMALVPYHRPHQQVVQQPVPVYQAQQQVVQQYPAQQAVAGFNKCEVVGGIAGGVIGSTASVHNDRRYHPQAVVLGTILGGVIGNAVCQPTQQVQGVQQYPVQNVVAQQQVQQGQGTPSCDAGKRPGILNLPGNQKHGQPVCAFPGDPNISQWL